MPTLSKRSSDLFFRCGSSGASSLLAGRSTNADGVKSANTDGVSKFNVDDELEALFKALCDCIANGNNCNLDLIPHPF